MGSVYRVTPSCCRQYRPRVYRLHCLLSLKHIACAMPKTVCPNAVICSQYLYRCLTSAPSTIHLVPKGLAGLHQEATFSVNVGFGLGLMTAS